MTTQSTRQERIQEITQAVRAMFNPTPDQVIELRIPGVGRKTFAGYFDGEHIEVLAKKALEYDGKADGIYVTLNEVNPALLARAYNRVGDIKQATSDGDIMRYALLLVDTDAVRPAGISATEEEKAAALERSAAIREWLTLHGWPMPRIDGDSGNGGHLLYSVDMPKDPESIELVKRVLSALDGRFSDDMVKVDTSVYNPARISKLYGTTAGKGDSIPTRPHRRATILRHNPDAQPVPIDLLRQVAALAPTDDKPDNTSRANGNGKPNMSQAEATEWVKEWCQQHSIRIAREKTHNGRTLLILEECPFNADHKAPDAAITVNASGAIGFKCFHNSCQGHGWRDVRERMEPGCYDRQHHTNGTGRKAGMPKPSRAARSAPPPDPRNAQRQPSPDDAPPPGDPDRVPAYESEYIPSDKPNGKPMQVLRPRFVLETLYDLDNLPPTIWLIPDRIPLDSLTLLYGASESGKSFIALHWALTVALRYPDRAVVYVAPEGGAGYCKRADAWLKHWKKERPANLHFIRSAPHMGDQADVAKLIATITPYQPIFIVLDTLARCAVGLDENSAKDMGLFIDGCDQVRVATNAAVMPVHHSGKNATNGARGSSAIRAAVDMAHEVVREGDTVVLSCDKSKDIAKPDPIYLSMVESADSLVLLPASRIARHTGAMDSQERALLEALSLGVFTETGAKTRQLVEVSGVPEGSAYRKLSTLRTRGYVQQGVKGDPYTITPAGRKALEDSDRGTSGGAWNLDDMPEPGKLPEPENRDSSRDSSQPELSPDYRTGMPNYHTIKLSEGPTVIDDTPEEGQLSAELSPDTAAESATITNYHELSPPIDRPAQSLSSPRNYISDSCESERAPESESATLEEPPHPTLTDTAQADAPTDSGAAPPIENDTGGGGEPPGGVVPVRVQRATDGYGLMNADAYFVSAERWSSREEAQAELARRQQQQQERAA